MSIQTDAVEQAVRDVFAIWEEHGDHEAVLQRLDVQDPSAVMAPMHNFATEATGGLPADVQVQGIASYFMALGFAVGLQAARRSREVGDE